MSIDKDLLDRPLLNAILTASRLKSSVCFMVSSVS